LLAESFENFLNSNSFIKMLKINLLSKAICLFFFFVPVISWSQKVFTDSYVSFSSGKSYFPLLVNGKTAPVIVSKEDFGGVHRAIEFFRNDLLAIGQSKPELRFDLLPKGQQVIILCGTLGKHAMIDALVRAKKLKVDDISGKWESYLIQSVDKPFPNVQKALVITGSDKRGTIFGIFDLSAKIGVSPWYWWADVPIERQNAVYIKPGPHSDGEPKVKYRGIFINDEAPALSGWTKEKFGGFNHKFYEKVFELILRLKGNMLWPAMWGNAFYDDDSLNAVIADDFGVVIGTSHHEPMMRAHDEWRRYGTEQWNYTTNETILKQFWRESIKRTGDKESIITLGMRGDGDMPMTEVTAIELLERIIAEQRQILQEMGKKPLTTIPQVWALYKEVQDYYDKGMRVPDDVTLLLCDDNWGNIRKLPRIDAKHRSGGYGIYYHFDYVGGPRNYKWLNTNPLPRIREQMNLAFLYGARQIWIVNVGDIKPMELPISFFLDFAWNPELIGPEQVEDYTRQWATQQFGITHADEISNLLAKYAKYNARRKPELLSPDTYSILNYREAESVVNEYNDLLAKATITNDLLAPAYRDAFYQLVLHPIQACANLNELYYTVALNRQYANQQRNATNIMAEKAIILFQRDADLSKYYNETLANGKWNHMMDQTHIGYTYWQQPPENKLPELKEYTPGNSANMGVAIEGHPHARTNAEKPLVLPELNSRTPAADSFFEIFNQGKTPFDFEITTAADYVLIEKTKGSIEIQERILIRVDWQKAPYGLTLIPLKIKATTGQVITVYAMINNLEDKIPPDFNGFLEQDGVVSILAEHYSRKSENNLKWQHLPDLGRIEGAMTIFPPDETIKAPGGESPRLEYDFYSAAVGEVRVLAQFSPTLAFNESSGLRYGISVDDEPVQIINVHWDKTQIAWERSVAENIRTLVSVHTLKHAGPHNLKFWAVDPGIVLQKLVIDLGGLKLSYLGPPESPRWKG
jgi:hypothetical protein